MSEAKPAISLAQLQELLASAPYHNHVPVRLTHHDADTGTVTLTMSADERLTRAHGSGQFHGGAIASLIDSAATFALIAKLGHAVATVDLTLNYLRPGTEELTAYATPRRVGRTVAIADVEVVDAKQRLVALGRATLTTRTA